MIDTFNPQRGGAESWTVQYAAHLIRHGHEVHVTAQEFAPTTARMDCVPHRLGRIRSLTDRAKAAEETLRTLKLDLIHDMGMGWHCDVLQPHGGCFRAVVEHKTRLMPLLLRPIKRLANAFSSRQRERDALVVRQCESKKTLLLALSRKIAEEFQQWYGFPQERIRVVHNGVDSERYSPEACEPHREAVRARLGLSPETVVGVVVAHNFILKGVPSLMKALAAATRRGAPLHILVVGGARLMPWRRYADLLGVGDRISFLGSHSDAIPFYAASDFLVLPSYYDSCSLVLLEGAACGLPVIGTRQNGASEMFAEGIEGYTLDDPGNSAALADRMERLLDRDLREKMGAAARQLALRHTLTRNFENIFATYADVVGRETRKAA